MYANIQTASARSFLRYVAILAATMVTAGYSAARAHPPTAPAAQRQPDTYTVVSGDDLAKIAAKHDLDKNSGWRLLYDANPSITDPDLIMPGQQLRIPARGKQGPRRPLTTPSSKSISGGSVWDRLAQCESGGNWSINRGTFDGGLQFLPSTWRAYGGTNYAPSADRATREQQIAIAERVRAGQGWRAWPACSRKLGLR